MIDKRLLGKWKSDIRMTIRDIRNRRDIKNYDKVKTLLGKMVVRYTRTRIYVDSEGDKSIMPYQVVAKDGNSVAILVNNHKFIISILKENIIGFVSKSSGIITEKLSEMQICN
jgi:hypothetical protein